VKKTKTIVANKKQPVLGGNILIDEAPSGQVHSMVHHGHMVTDDGKIEKVIKRRIELARNAYNNKSTLLSSRDRSLAARKGIVKCF